MNGVTVLVGTAEHPAIVAPARVNVAEPATLVVATMVAGLVAEDPGTSPLPPLKTTVGTVVVAEAVPTPNATTLPRAKDPMASMDMTLFIMILLLLLVATTS
jgi:hypothetical protein